VINKAMPDAPAQAAQTQTVASETQTTGEQAAAAEKPATDASEAAPTLTQKQINAAKHLGFSDAEIAEISPQEIKLIERLSKTYRKLESKAGSLAEQLKQTQATQTTPTDKKPAEDAAARPAESSPEPEAITETDDWETIVRKSEAVRQRSLDMEKQLKAIQDQLGNVTAQIDEPRIRQQMAQADEVFNSLDQEIYDQFGQGKTLEMEPDDPECVARFDVIELAKELQDFNSRKGKTTDFGECVENALAIANKEQFTKSAQKSVISEVNKRARGGVARPSGTQTQPRVVDELQEARTQMMSLLATL
jgi:hypothetical protein